MATQKVKMSKMARHEKSESASYERAEEGTSSRHHMDETKGFEKKEERIAKEHFAHGANIPEHRQKHYKMGKMAHQHREDTELYAPGK